MRTYRFIYRVEIRIDVEAQSREIAEDQAESALDEIIQTDIVTSARGNHELVSCLLVGTNNKVSE